VRAWPVGARLYPRNKERVLRKLLVGVIAGVVMLAMAAIALATTTTTFDQKYSTKSTNKSAGTNFKTTSSDDQNAENNHQPKSTREFDITFPAGSKINYKAAPVCKNLDESANDPCPKNTKVGSGHASVLLTFGPPIDALVTAYNRKNGLFLFIVPQAPGQAPVVLKPEYHGLTLKTATPPNCVASTNQNGHCVDGNGNPGFEAVLTEFDLKTNAITKGKGKHKVNYLTTPPKCPKGGWVFKAKVTYADGTSVGPKSTSPCK
jgi:hypothetical protein